MLAVVAMLSVWKMSQNGTRSNFLPFFVGHLTHSHPPSFSLHLHPPGVQGFHLSSPTPSTPTPNTQPHTHRLFGMASLPHPHGRLCLVAGTSVPDLSQAIAEYINVSPVECAISHFKYALPLSPPLSHLSLPSPHTDSCSDGELNIEAKGTVRNDHVFIVQSTCTPVNDTMMELLLLVRTFVRANARQITVVIPYMGYSRQDTSSDNNSATVAASDMMFLLQTAGASDVISVNLHSEQIEGFVHGAVDNLKPWLVFVDPIIALSNSDAMADGEAIVVVAPSAKAVPRVQEFRDQLLLRGIETELAVIVRDVDAPNVDAPISDSSLGADELIKVKASLSRTMVGSSLVPGAHCIVIDDIAFTGNTLLGTIEELASRGAASIRACITHPVFSQPDFMSRLDACDALTEIFVTDTIPLDPASTSPKIRIVSVAEIIGESIIRSYTAEVLDPRLLAPGSHKRLSKSNLHQSPRKRRFHINQ